MDQEAANRRGQAMDRLQMAHGLLQKRKKAYATVRASTDGGVGGRAEKADVEVKEVCYAMQGRECRQTGCTPFF